MGRHLPAPPSYASPPPLWGSEDHVKRLFEGGGLDLEFDRDVVVLRFGSVEEIVEFYTTRFGPLVAARQSLERQGQWAALVCDLWTYFENSTEPEGVGIAWAAEYLVVLGRKSTGDAGH